jgi:hypothetical protein
VPAPAGVFVVQDVAALLVIATDALEDECERATKCAASYLLSVHHRCAVTAAGAAPLD